jgi:hypothetical protein
LVLSGFTVTNLVQVCPNSPAPRGSAWRRSTIFLRRHREDIIKREHAERQIEARIAEYERELRLSLTGISRRAEEKPELIQIPS